MNTREGHLQEKMFTKTAGQQSYHDRKQSYASVRLEPDSEKECLAPDYGWGKKCAKGGLQECIQVPPNLGGLAGLWGTKSTEEGFSVTSDHT